MCYHKPSIIVGCYTRTLMRHWNNSAFERQVHALARDSQSVQFTFHARTRMAQRLITVPMVLECLRRGVIRRPPEQNIKTGWYACRMERYTAGKSVAVIAAIDEDNPAVIVVTVIELDP